MSGDLRGPMGNRGPLFVRHRAGPFGAMKKEGLESGLNSTSRPSRIPRQDNWLGSRGLQQLVH